MVYDAEDLPEPQQLRKAAAALVAAPPQVACLQANLHVWNADRNWLAHYGASEFAHLCQVFRAGLERMDSPILLCGTSVHLRTAVLRELSGWDEFNVAEDADLGVRLARAGYRTQMLDSNTYEEANTKLWNWIRQRSRWIKGWVQTWLVHNRHPWRLWRDLGVRRAAQLQLTLGLPVAQAFLAPASWSLPLLWVLALCGIRTFIPEWLLTAGSIAFVWMGTVEIVTHAIALRRADSGYVMKSVWAVPLFGLLKTIAAWKAIGQLITRPHYWEKTVHGFEAQHPGVGWPNVVAGESSG